MKKNVGLCDAYLRITFGLIGLAYSIACASRHKGSFPWAMTLLSAMKVAEGVVRYCPMLAMLGKDTSKKSSTPLSASSIINEITNP